MTTIVLKNSFIAHLWRFIHGVAQGTSLGPLLLYTVLYEYGTKYFLGQILKNSRTRQSPLQEGYIFGIKLRL